MRIFLSLVFFALSAAAAAASTECPICDGIDAWFAENGPDCDYQGARLGHLCDADPVCVEWRRVCGEKQQELRDCIARCMSGDTGQVQPAAPELDEFERDWAELERSGVEPFPGSNSPE